MTMQVEAEDRNAHVPRSSSLSWMHGWTYRAVRGFSRRQGWKIKEVD